MEYFIGIDGGGTGSRLVSINRERGIIGRGFGGATNIASIGREAVSSNIMALFAQLGSDIDECKGICIGSAGATVGENRQFLKDIFRNMGYAGEVSICNDGELMLLAETGGDAGAILISGTGSVAYAIDRFGTRHRAGGFGHIVDDGGSGYRIGMDAIKAVKYAFDGRGPETLLSGLIQIDIDFIYGPDFDKAEIAKLAILVRDAAGLGDAVAMEIESRAAGELVLLASAVITRAGLAEEPHKLVISGSVILNNQNIRDMFESEMHRKFPIVEIVEPCQSPELGAALLAHSKFMNSGNS